jgi:hypothetical protein
LLTIKEDSEILLMDLHSSDKVSDFFKIDLIHNDEEESMLEAEKAKKSMEELINVEFKDSLDDIKNFCEIMIEKSDKMLTKVEKLL